MWRYLVKTPQPSKSNFTFKMQHSFEKRLKESQRLKERYQNKVPIIVEKADHSILPEIKRSKYLIENDVTIAQLIYLLRSNIQLSSSEAIFLYVDNSHIPSNADKIESVYKKYADKDGFLYITYAAENTFG
ncbi:MAG: autophagy protein Atg8 ubiquitin-like protein [Homavirus sp.]|uniref:Autophagy protein Atg8 ubiquitin-like protein n=1 Tax=Homavirus sp. TaxID=2487769 RepID=A0A3G5A9M0_9VIRU|nr:MAG: autophagy protein Atg8 ubiquitin-like protein [Homavirus sp.]